MAAFDYFATLLRAIGNVIKESQQESKYRGQLYDGTVDTSDSQNPSPPTSDPYNL